MPIEFLSPMTSSVKLACNFVEWPEAEEVKFPYFISMPLNNYDKTKRLRKCVGI